MRKIEAWIKAMKRGERPLTACGASKSCRQIDGMHAGRPALIFIRIARLGRTGSACGAFSLFPLACGIKPFIMDGVYPKA